MTQADFYDWKRHPVTVQVFQQLAGRVRDIKDILAETAGKDPAQDREYVGAVKAYMDILEISYDEEVTQ